MSLPILLKNPKILLIGAGNVALQKAKVLHENGIYFKTIF
jgi:uroporphyrin-III C-methyltransferase/precorrin-2 dehydrogenase/sirohydrochlorin ferrochelatase